MRARTAGWAVLVGWVIVQIYALYVYVPGPGPGIPYADKIAHFLLFGVPAAVAAGMRSRWALFTLLTHAVVSEPLQALLTTARTADRLDLLADLLGIVVGMGIGREVAERAGRNTAPRSSTGLREVGGP